jgi:Membrane-associated phospholipid phosphatase
MINLKNYTELGVLAMVAAANAALLVFIKIAAEVSEGETEVLDLAILMWLRSPTDPSDPLGPLWLEDFVRDITALGSPIVLGLLVLTSIIYLVLAGQRLLWLFMLLATGSGALASLGLKALFGRDRPDLSLHGMPVYASSFPSGHAMLSTLVYLTLATLIARLAPSPVLKLYIMVVALAFSTLVGISRIYLGVHWPTDVLAGWAAGAAWALACGAIARIIHLGTGETP